MLDSHFIQVNGVQLHYLRAGTNKPTLLLLHGLTDSGACWTPVIDVLSNDYDLIAPDARGHGLSDAPAHGYSSQDHARDVAGLIEALALDKPIVMGHSMGGATATALAAQHSEFIRAVILEDPAWFDLAQRPSEARELMVENWRTIWRDKQTKTEAELIAQEHGKNPRWSDAELWPWAAAQKQVRIEALQYVEQPPQDWHAQVQAIRCPMLLVTGDASRGVVISPAQAAKAQSLNLKLRVAHVTDAGHCIRRDNFAEYMAAVHAFLRTVVG